MDNHVDSAAKIVRHAREAKSMTQGDLAKKVGTRQQTIGKIESGKIKHSRFFRKIAMELDVSLDSLDPSSIAIVKRPLVEPSRPEIIPARALQPGQHDLPVHVAAEGGRGEMIVSTDPVDWVLRPERLTKVADGYGIIIVGESMKPEFDPGDTALVHPHLPPLRDVTCIFYAERAGEARATIKRLVRFTEKVWFVRQFNPPKSEPAEFTLSRAEWRKCHRVVGRYTAR